VEKKPHKVGNEIGKMEKGAMNRSKRKEAREREGFLLSYKRHRCPRGIHRQSLWRRLNRINGISFDVLWNLTEFAAKEECHAETLYHAPI
jgi:hypothetical protein